MVSLRIADLPDDALAAATEFHAKWLPVIGASDDTVLLFTLADHTHRAWRLAAVQSLARQFAPLRVNAIESDDAASVAAAEAYLANAPGLTGQLLRLDGEGAGTVV